MAVIYPMTSLWFLLLLVAGTRGSICTCRGRRHSSRRARGVHSTTRSGEEAFLSEGCTSNMPSADVAK